MPDPTLVIRGGSLVGPDGLARLDVALAGDTVLALAETIDRTGRGHRARRVGLSGRARLGRPAHPPAPAGPRGGRDGRERGAGRRTRGLHRGRGHAQHRADDRFGRGGPRGARSRARRAGRGGGGRRHHRRTGRPCPRPDGGTGRPRRDALHRRRRWGTGRRADAACPRLRQGPRRHAGPALRRQLPGQGRGHARGLVVQPARHPRHAGGGRGGHGRPRHRAGPPDRSARALLAPVQRRARWSWSGWPNGRACP